MLLALAGGLVVATQARINAQFGLEVGLPIAAALLSAGTGLVLVSLATMLTPRARAAVRDLPAAIRGGLLPWWVLLAGALGGFVLFSQTFSVPALGVAVYSVLVVASITGAGLLVDRAGLGPAGHQAITGRRVGGASLAVVAALVSAGPELALGTLALGAAVVAIAAGTGAAVQSAMLGRIGVGSGHPLAATWANFVGATLALALMVGIATAAGGSWRLPPVGWWWLGGPLGLLIVGTIVVTVPRAGVLLVTLAVTAGQLLGALVWDWLAPVAGRGVDAWSVAGVVLLMGAVVLAAAPRRRAG